MTLPFLPTAGLDDENQRRRVRETINQLIKTTNKILLGDGSPEGVVTADVSSIYLRQDGGASTSIYIKESGTGNTGWVPFVTGTVSIPTILVASKATDTARSSTTSPTADPNLSVALAAGTRYAIEMFLRFNCTSSNSQGFRWQIAYSGSLGSGSQRLLGVSLIAGTLTTATMTTSQSDVASPDQAPDISYFNLQGNTHTNTAGTFSINWSQVSSSANATNLLAGSYIKLTKVQP